MGASSEREMKNMAERQRREVPVPILSECGQNGDWLRARDEKHGSEVDMAERQHREVPVPILSDRKLTTFELQIAAMPQGMN